MNYFKNIANTSDLEENNNASLVDGLDYISKAIRCIFAKLTSDRRFILVLVGLNIAILVFALVAGNILDGGIYVPCFGCAEDGTIFKCASGTGKGTSACEAYKKTMSIFDSLIGFIVDAGIFLGDLVGYIVDAIGYIKDGVIVLFEAILWLFKAPAYLISKLASFLPLLEPNADFTIDLGKLLVGCTD